MASAFKTHAQDGALDYRIGEQSRDAFARDVVSCRYAGFDKALGEPELGFLPVCTADFAVADGFGSDIAASSPHSILAKRSECHADRLNPPPKADIPAIRHV